MRWIPEPGHRSVIFFVSKKLDLAKISISTVLDQFTGKFVIIGQAAEQANRPELSGLCWMSVYDM